MMMMVMINTDEQISHSPYYSETQSSIALPGSLVSTFDAPLRTVSPVALSPSCPPIIKAPTKMRKPTEAPLEPPSPFKKRRCKNVCFGPDITLAYIESATEFTQLEKDDRWYRSTEIASFKESARVLCRDTRNSNSNKRISISSDVDDEQDSIRGLDVYSSSRQRFTKMYTQHVLEAYYVRCVGNDEHVALLAEKWSKKSLSRAIDTAQEDFMVAYFPEELGYGSPPQTTLSISSTLLPKDSYHIRVGAQ